MFDSLLMQLSPSLKERVSTAILMKTVTQNDVVLRFIMKHVLNKDEKERLEALVSSINKKLRIKSSWYRHMHNKFTELIVSKFDISLATPDDIMVQ